MLDDILQALHEVQGVQATLVIDAGGRILAHRAHAVYDFDLLQQVGRSIVRAVDSVQVLHDDWELVTANFSDGKVLIRNLRPAGRQVKTAILAVIADPQLNRSFAGVAIRVAAGKLKAEIESPAFSPAPARQPTGRIPTMSGIAAAGPSGGRQAAPGAGASADLTGSGLSWSASVSSAGTSGVAVVDGAAAAFLSSCTKALSASVGPMAKVFVKEAVRKLCADQEFSRNDGAALVAELEKRIDDSDDRKLFLKVMRSA